LRFYTADECEAWLKGRERVKPDADDKFLRLRLNYPREPHRIYYMAYWIASQLTHRLPVLLWMTEWGIWGSSENWHMYYRLRQSYGDYRLIYEAPGHLFLEYEAEDLVSFLQLSMLNGWGGYVLTGANYENVFFSHDEFIDFFSENKGTLDEIEKEIGGDKTNRLRIQ